MRPIPDSVVGLLDDLEEYYPPRCKDPAESLEQHLLYAGSVQLIADLRIRYDWTQEYARAVDILK